MRYPTVSESKSMFIAQLIYQNSCVQYSQANFSVFCLALTTTKRFWFLPKNCLLLVACIHRLSLLIFEDALHASNIEIIHFIFIDYVVKNVQTHCNLWRDHIFIANNFVWVSFLIVSVCVCVYFVAFNLIILKREKKN